MSLAKPKVTRHTTTSVHADQAAPTPATLIVALCLLAAFASLGTAAVALAASPPKPGSCHLGQLDEDGCAIVPLRSGPLAGAVDGFMTDGEYQYPVALPIAYPEHTKQKPEAVRITAAKIDAAAGSKYVLRVFLQDLLVETPDPMKMAPPPIAVYLDLDRFSSATPLAAGDRGFLLSAPKTTQQGSATALVPDTAGSAWIELTTAKSDWAGATVLKSTLDLGNGAKAYVVDGEIELSIPAGLAPLAQGYAGIGLAVAIAYDWKSGKYAHATFPEAMLQAASDALGADTKTASVSDRLSYYTLLLGEPKGKPVSFMSWNIHRFTPAMHFFDSSDHFDDYLVSDYDVATALFDLDVVGIQEGFDGKSVKAIAKEANKMRAARGLAPYQVIGPVEWKGVWSSSASFWGYLVDNQQVGGDDQGGVWILSCGKLVETDQTVFESCSGFDCLKPKGVLHARLNLEACGKCENGRCPEPESDFAAIDVFNTHLNASEMVCGSPSLMTQLMEQISDAAAAAWQRYAASCLSGASGGQFGWGAGSLPEPCEEANPSAIAKLEELAGKTVEEMIEEMEGLCAMSTAKVQTRQLEQMAAFIASHTQKDRPAVVMGDFNIDGKALGLLDNDGTLQPDPDKLYAKALLHAANSGQSLASLPAGAIPSCKVTPWTGQFDWQIEECDVAREVVQESDWLAGGPGTYIGQDNASANDRFDYIFVRPPYPSSSPKWKGGDPGVDYLIKKRDGAPVWQTVPQVAGKPGAPTSDEGQPLDRLSDHLPVVAHVELFPLQVLPAFHIEWPHSFDYHVASYDASGVEDCWLDMCGPVDPYAKLNLKVSADGFPTFEKKTTTSECTSKPSAAFEAAACMKDWKRSSSESGASGKLGYAHVAAKLYEDDDPSGDDALIGGWYRWAFDFGVGKFLHGWDGKTLESLKKATLGDISTCSSGHPNLCGTVRLEEVTTGLPVAEWWAID
ncbi:MAG: hypothetical protein HYV63_02015 [Candidatus Schekmanbacteria bacterium]|nr:hypothetical protein [Candidatus Schekmanbacteria bacterium]